MMETHFESSQGKIYYEVINKKKETTLLLLHGFMENHTTWNLLAPQLETNLIMVDLLGFGKSTPYPGFDFTMQQHATSIVELLEFLHPNNCKVLGHSMGGYIGLELSLLNPNLPLALLHSTCKQDSEERKINRNKTIEVLEKDPGIFIREFYWNLFADHRKNEFSHHIEVLKTQATNIPVFNIIQTVKALRDRKDHTSTWQSSAQNNLLIGGSFDKLLDVQELKDLASLGGAGWVQMQHSGHMSFYEEPEALAIALKHWLQIQ